MADMDISNTGIFASPVWSDARPAQRDGFAPHAVNFSESRAQVLALFSKYEAECAAGQAQADECITAICSALEAHGRDEEKYFCDLVEESSVLWIAFGETLMMQAEVEDYISKIRRNKADQADNAQAIANLQKLVKHHFYQEEIIIFPQVNEELQNHEAGLPLRPHARLQWPH